MLDTFQLHERLGEGADSEAFAATDTRTGAPVVVKRPHPMLIARGQHDAVERRMEKVIALRERLGDALPHVAKMLAIHATGEPRRLLRRCAWRILHRSRGRRARGVPLVGSAIDGIKRHPIGAPQNLFAVHPVIAHGRRGRFSIVRDILEVAEAFHGVGALILDMRPQNIYFAPDDAAITVIDIGGVTEAQSASGGKPALDLHDLYLELFKWYIPHSAPPNDADGYRQPVGMETVPMFRQNIDVMIRHHEAAPKEAWRAATLDMLHKVKARAYPDIRRLQERLPAIFVNS